MTIESAGEAVLVCETQPVAIEGVRWLLSKSDDLRFGGAACSLADISELAQSLQPAAIILDKTLGVSAVMDWLRQAPTLGIRGAGVVWGSGINEPEAIRFLQAGARGILRRTSSSETMLACLRAVTSGTTWIEDGVFGGTGGITPLRRSHLTAREQQVSELAERGLRNRDIADVLGIQTGTVKIHLKHIYEKIGVRGRYGLALTGLREKGTIPPLPVSVAELPSM